MVSIICLLYVRLESRVIPDIFALMFMGSVEFIFSANCVLYAAWSAW